MIDRTNAVIAGAMALLMCAACASTPDQESEYHEKKFYRTGSNIPAKDYGAENTEVRNSDIINPANRPMAPVSNKKAGPGGG